MFNRIIRIVATAAGCALLLAGCSLWLDDPARNPQTDSEAICFSAGSALLRDDAPVSKATLSESFVEGNTFAVFGNRVISGVQTTVFGGTNGVTVTLTNHDDNPGTPPVWTYSPVKLWYWESSGDWYDFIAVSPAGEGSVKMDIAGNLAVSTHYNLTSHDYDILGATYRRRGNVQDPCGTVPMVFNHLGSAVIVRILNNSELTDVTLDEVKYKNLVVEGDSKLTLDLYGNPERSWINTERNTSFVRLSSPDQLIEADDSYDCAPDVMIPQRLDQAAAAGNNVEDMPALYLYYTPDGSTQKEAIVRLKDICPRDSDTPITSWVAGTKYIYEISMRLDGGVLVTVETTDWGETIEAETPGLLIQ